MKPEFNPEEQRMLDRLRRSARNAWVGWGLVLSPLVVFAIYGIVRRDVAAVFIGWVGLVIWLLWWIASANKSGAAIRSIIGKFDRALAEADAHKNEGG